MATFRERLIARRLSRQKSSSSSSSLGPIYVKPSEVPSLSPEAKKEAVVVTGTVKDPVFKDTSGRTVTSSGGSSSRVSQAQRDLKALQERQRQEELKRQAELRRLQEQNKRLQAERLRRQIERQRQIENKRLIERAKKLAEERNRLLQLPVTSQNIQEELRKETERQKGLQTQKSGVFIPPKEVREEIQKAQVELESFANRLQSSLQSQVNAGTITVSEANKQLTKGINSKIESLDKRFENKFGGEAETEWKLTAPSSRRLKTGLQKFEKKLTEKSGKIDKKREELRKEVLKGREEAQQRLQEGKIQTPKQEIQQFKKEAKLFALASLKSGIVNLKAVVNLTDIATNKQTRKEFTTAVALIATDRESRKEAGKVITEEAIKFGKLIKTSPTEAVAQIGTEIFLLKGTGKVLSITSRATGKVLKKSISVAGRNIKLSTALNKAFRNMKRIPLEIKKGGKIAIAPIKKTLTRTSRSLDKSTKKVIKKIEKEIGEKLTDAEKILISGKIKKGLSFSAQTNRLKNDLKNILRLEKRTNRIKRIEKKLGLDIPRKIISKEKAKLKSIRGKSKKEISKAKERFSKKDKTKKGKKKTKSKKETSRKVKSKTLNQVGKERALDKITLRQIVLLSRRKDKIKISQVKKTLINNVKKEFKTRFPKTKITTKEITESFRRSIKEFRRPQEFKIIKGKVVKTKPKKPLKVRKKKPVKKKKTKEVKPKAVKGKVKPKRIIKRTGKKARIVPTREDKANLIRKLSNNEEQVRNILKKYSNIYKGRRTPKQKAKDISRLKKVLNKYRTVRAGDNVNLQAKLLRETKPFITRESKKAGRLSKEVSKEIPSGRSVLIQKSKVKTKPRTKTKKVSKKKVSTRVKTKKARLRRPIISLAVASARLTRLVRALGKAKTSAEINALRKAVDTLQRQISESARATSLTFAQAQDFRRLLRNTNKFEERLKRIPKKLPLKFKSSKRLKPAPEKVKGYDVYVKTKGKFKKFNKLPLRKNDALDRASYITDQSTAVTYKIVPLTKVKKLGKITSKEVGARNKIKSREFKIKKKRKITTPRRFIEKKGKPRINTRGEVKGLSASRVAKGLKTRKKVRKKKR